MPEDRVAGDRFADALRDPVAGRGEKERARGEDWPSPAAACGRAKGSRGGLPPFRALKGIGAEIR